MSKTKLNVNDIEIVLYKQNGLLMPRRQIYLMLSYLNVQQKIGEMQIRI